MDSDSDPPPNSRKRLASVALLSTPPPSDNTAPRVLRRYHHRKPNPAAELWGPDLALSSFAHEARGPCGPFNIYKAMLRHAHLFFQFTLRLPLESAIDLYAMDKEFHYLFNKYSVSILHDYARYWAPTSSHVFTWHLFPDLCISDPTLRPMNDRAWLARDVPSWRWVRMCLYRQRIVGDILLNLQTEGCGALPPGTEAVLYQFWLLTSFSSTAQRAAFVRDATLWPDAHLVLFHAFVLKLDMRLAHPLVVGPASLAHLLLCQPSLAPLHALLLHPLHALAKIHLTHMLLRTYPMARLDTRAFPHLESVRVTGVDEPEWGLLSKEGWDENGAEMLPAVDLLVQEGVRRELHLQRCVLDFVMMGFAGGVRRRWRSGERLYDGWLVGREKGEVVRGLDRRFGLVGGGGRRRA
ncbi:hypothetical protein ACEQ8H_008535 [Pleosporales sp. CAS-2024a]